MERNMADELSMALIHQAEDECAAHDPGMLSSAAMVLVGDVYALQFCRPDASARLPAASSIRERQDRLSPFIR
jgi:hypothetical protein